MVSRRLAAAPAALILSFSVARGAAAQAVCSGHPIREIRVYPSSLFGIEPEPFPRIVQEAAEALSWNTRREVVQHDLRLQPGEMCDPGRLAESERILRARAWLRSAEIITTPAPGDSVDLEVGTRDDWSLGGNLRLDTRRSSPIRAARLTETNLLGRGIYVQGRYDDYGRRPGFSADVVHPQLPMHSEGELLWGRSSVGPVAEAALRRPFQSEYDHFGWRITAHWRKEPFLLHSARYGFVVEPLTAAGMDAGLMWRNGGIGDLQVLGGATLSGERLFPSGSALAANPVDDSSASADLSGRFQERRRIALNFIVGLRRIRYVPRWGIDAVNAREDIRMGVEARTIAGVAIGGSGGNQRDRFALADVYVGGEALGGRTLVFARSRVEGRWLTDFGEWSNVIAALEVFTYTTVSPRGVVALGIKGAGGWNMTTPFQLDLAGGQSLRGFAHSSLPVGRRVVAQAEHRYFLGTFRGFVDIGTSAFVDVGQGWAGDAVFGTTTPLLASVGAGIRLGFPSGSRYATRLDLAVPVRGGYRPELRFSIRQQFGVTQPEPEDVERSRMPVSTVGLFNFSRY